MRRHGNRIGGHKKRSFLYGTVRPRVISECGNMNNPRPLAYEACLKKTCADSASLDAMISASWHKSHQNQKDQKLSKHFTRPLISSHDWAPVRWPRLSTVNYRSLWGRCQSMNLQAFTPLRNLSLRTGVTEQSELEAGKSVGAHPLHRLVWQYMSIVSHVYAYTFLMNNEFSTLVQSLTNQNSNNKSDSCPRTRLRYSSVTRLQSHKEPLGSRRRSYRQIQPTSLIQWQSSEHQC
jgi:hypothetical protein